MLKSMYSAVSGMSVNQTSMDVIGNNIANVNTIGFKMGRAVFQDLMSQTLSGARAPSGSMGGINPVQVGSGATLAGIDTIFEGGSPNATQRVNDLAIAGEGFFIVSGGGEQNSYTRAGDFEFDISGTLTTPTGYKVQGWMHDPVTGAVINDGVTSDIVLGEEYKVMLSKESTEVNIAGVLDTRATPSTLEYPMFMTQALGNQSIFDLANSTGVDLGISKGDTITIKSHITNNTDMGEIVGSSGQTIGLHNGNFIQFNIAGISAEVLTYDSSGTHNPGDGKFTTVEEFIEEMNFMLKRVAKGTSTDSVDSFTPAANLSIVNGQFELDSNLPFTIDSMSGTGILTDLLGGLSGSYVAGQKRNTNELFVQQDVVAGTDFDSMDDFASEINGAINGQVVDNGFLAEFLDNNFGMSDGEGINIGAKVMVTTTYAGGNLVTLIDAMTLTATLTIAAGTNVTLGDDMNIANSGFKIGGDNWSINGGNVILGGSLHTSTATPTTIAGTDGMTIGEKITLSAGASIINPAGIADIKLGGQMTVPTTGAAATWSPFGVTNPVTTSASITGTIVLPTALTLPANMTVTVPGTPADTVYPAGSAIPAGTTLPVGTIIAGADLTDFEIPAGASVGAGFNVTATIPTGFIIPAGTHISAGAALTGGVMLSKGTSIPGGTTLNFTEEAGGGLTLPQGTILTDGMIIDGATLSPANSLPNTLTLPAGTEFTPANTLSTNGYRDIDIPLKYTSQPGPQQGSGSFNTVSELARELAFRLSNLQSNLAPGAIGYTPGFDQARDVVHATNVNYSMNGNAFTLSYGGGADIQLSESDMVPAPGGDAPNPFLKTILDASFTRVNTAGGTVSNVELNTTNKNASTGDIDGTGRLSYTYSATTENSLVDLSNPGTDLGMNKGTTGVPGDKITFNFGTDQIVIEYTDDPNVSGGFSDVKGANGIEAAINEALLAKGGVYSGLDFQGNFDETPPTFEFSTSTGAAYPFGKVTSTSSTPYLADMFDTAVRGTVVRNTTPVVGSAIVANVPSITGLEFISSRANDNFTKNLLDENLANNGISLDRSTVSDVFLTVADEDTEISDLYSDQGIYLGFSETNTNITFDASIDSEDINNPNFFNVTTDTTVQDLMDAMEAFLNLGNEHNEFGNVFMKDGKINIVGEKGAGNNIDFFKLEGPSTPGFASFNNYISRVTQTTATGGFGTTSFNIYDEQGNPHLLSFDFALSNESNNEWKMKVSTPEEFNTVSIDGARTNEVTIKFNPDGTIAYVFDDTQTPVAILNDLKLDYTTSNGTNSINDISLNLGAAGEQDGLIIQGSPGYFSRSDTDGYPLGTLKEASFNTAGEFVGTYTNGQIRTLAQLALATFANNQGLTRAGDTMFQETSNSGQPSIGRAETGSKGKVMAGNLERSNVDLSREMVDMIITQRGFQSNSRVVTTSDEMIQEVLNMKR